MCALFPLEMFAIASFKMTDFWIYPPQLDPRWYSEVVWSSFGLNTHTKAEHRCVYRCVQAKSCAERPIRSYLDPTNTRRSLREQGLSSSPAVQHCSTSTETHLLQRTKHGNHADLFPFVISWQDWPHLFDLLHILDPRGIHLMMDPAHVFLCFSATGADFWCNVMLLQ